MKIEQPKEPDVKRLWTEDPASGGYQEWHLSVELDTGRRRWMQADSRYAPVRMTFKKLLETYDAVYTTHPDFAALERYPAPWAVGASGTVRSANNKAVLDPTLRCPPCLTALIVRAVNELAEQVSGSAAAGECVADEEDEKR